jgi:hypothetical protein
MTADDHQAVIAEALAYLRFSNETPSLVKAAKAKDARRALASLTQRLQDAETALEVIARNAESWHGPESEGTGAARALAVIAGWARDPSTIPAALAAAGTGEAG